MQTAIGNHCLYFQISESNFGVEHQLASEKAVRVCGVAAMNESPALRKILNYD